MPVARVLLRRVLGEPEHRVLRRGVVRLAGRGHHSGARRHVHDRATVALREHLAQLVLHAEEHAGEVDVDHALPLGAGVVDERLRLDADPGHVARAVEPAEALDRERDHRARPTASSVTSARNDRDPVVGVDQRARSRRAPGSSTSAITTDAPRVGEHLRGRAADPVAAAGHERDATVEIAHVSSSRPSSVRIGRSRSRRYDSDFTTSPFSRRRIAGRERERGLGHRLDRLEPLGRQLHHRDRALGRDRHLGRDRVHRDARRAELGRQRLGEPVERRLARRVGGRARELRAALRARRRGVGDDARDVDDPTRAPLPHRRAPRPSRAGTA